jgi:hypothetical protein
MALDQCLGASSPADVKHLVERPRAPWSRLASLAGLRELFLVATLYLAYTASRTLADRNVHAAGGRARRLLMQESRAHLAWEHGLNQFFVNHDLVGLLGSYWYSTTHYLLTAGVLVWLYRGDRSYASARWALVVATGASLVLYLLDPTAPPRLATGYTDVLALHRADGWWGSDASAPRGLGQLTNELAAFPSLHAGWSLWVALVVQSRSARPSIRVLGWIYALLTAAVVVGTANHWVADVVGGWLICAVPWVAAGRLFRRPSEKAAGKSSALRLSRTQPPRGRPEPSALPLGSPSRPGAPTPRDTHARNRFRVIGRVRSSGEALWRVLAAEWTNRKRPRESHQGRLRRPTQHKEQGLESVHLLRIEGQP